MSFVHYLADETAPSESGLDHLVLAVTSAPVVAASKAPPVLVVVAKAPVVVELSNRLHDLGDVLSSIVDMTSAVTVSGAGNGETSSIDIAEVENDYFKAIASFDEVQQVGQPAEDEMFIEAFVTKYLDGSDEISTELVGPKDVFFVNLLESRPLSVIFRPEMTIRELQTLVADHTGISSDEARCIMFELGCDSGRCLSKGDATVSQYGVHPGSTLSILGNKFCLAGGSGWDCPLCTYSNTTTTRVCDLCLADKPVVQPRRRQRTDNNNDDERKPPAKKRPPAKSKRQPLQTSLYQNHASSTVAPGRKLQKKQPTQGQPKPHVSAASVVAASTFTSAASCSESADFRFAKSLQQREDDMVVSSSCCTGDIDSEDTKMPAVNDLTRSSKSTSATHPTADEIYAAELQYRQEDAFGEFDQLDDDLDMYRIPACFSPDEKEMLDAAKNWQTGPHPTPLPIDKSPGMLFSISLQSHTSFFSQSHTSTSFFSSTIVYRIEGNAQRSQELTLPS